MRFDLPAAAVSASVAAWTTARTGILIAVASGASNLRGRRALKRNPTTKLFAQNIGHLVNTRLDPLVNPGTCSSHVHSVLGNAKFAAEVTPEMYADADWRNSEGKYEQTTSELIPNLSSY